MAYYRQSWILQPTTAVKRLDLLKSFFKFCIDRRWLLDDPTRALRKPKVVRKEPIPFTAHDKEKIFATINSYTSPKKEKLFAMAQVFLNSGIRISDLVQIKPQYINGDNILHMISQKNHKSLHIPLPDDCIKALADWRGFLPHDSEYYFWQGKKTLRSAIVEVQKEWFKVFRNAGVKGSLHVFRHTFSTDLLSQGVSTDDVASLLGDSQKTVETFYSTWIAPREERLLNIVKATWQK